MKTVLGSSTGFSLAAGLISSSWQNDLPAWAERLGWTLVHSIWEFTVIGIIAVLIDRLLFRHTANTRYLTAVAFFCMMSFLPGVTWMLVDVREHRAHEFIGQNLVESRPTRVTATHTLEKQDNSDETQPIQHDASAGLVFVQDVAQSRVAGETTSAAIIETSPVVTGLQTATHRWPVVRLRAMIEPQLPWVVLSWIAGVLLFINRPILGLWTQSQLGRTGISPVPAAVQRMLSDVMQQLGMRRTIRIAESVYVHGPMVVGYLWPIILFPVNLLKTLTPPQLRAVLAHELAHIRRHDMLVNALQVVAETLLFYHPAVWCLSRLIRHERENCCDDLAILLSGDRVAYAQMLLSLQELRQPIPEPMLAATGGMLVTRVRRLMPNRDIVGHRQPSWLPGTALLLAVAASAFFWSLLQTTRTVAQPPDLPASAESLTGIVLQDDGSPAAGATVTAASFFPWPPRRMTTTTDERGKFYIEIPRLIDEAFGTGRSISFTVAIRWKTFGADIAEALDTNGQTVPIEGQQLPLQTIRLRPGGRLRGKLLQQEDDHPIARATLFLGTGELLTTNEHGEFDVSGFPMQANSLVAVAPGRAREYIAFDTFARPDAELEIRLPQGATVKGHIVDADGKPVRGAFVQYYKRGASFLAMNGWHVACLGDGTFEFDGLSPSDSRSTLVASAPGFDPEDLTIAACSPFEVIQRTVTLSKSGAAEEKRLRATEPTTITGTVRDAAGLPLQGVTVRNGNSCQQRVEVSTDPAGRFTLTSTERLDSLVAVASGHAPQLVVMSFETRASFVLPVGVQAHGVVVDAAGQPVSGVQVTTTLHGGPPHARLYRTDVEQRSTETNSDGEFQIANVPSENVAFNFRKEGFSVEREITLALDGSVNTIRLNQLGGVKGQVVDMKGRPVRNFKIRPTYPRPFKSERPVANLDETNAVHFTRDDGRFALTGYDANSWLRLIISSPGIGYATIDSIQSKPLDDRSNPEGLTISLKPFAPLIVQVQEASSGKAISGATVRLFDREVDLTGYGPLHWDEKESFAVQVDTNADGEVRFADLEFDYGILAVNVPGFGQRRVPWMPGERLVKIPIDVEARVEGQVRSNGEPFDRGTAELHSEHHRFLIDLAKTGGAISFNRVPAGEYDLWVRGTDDVLMTRHLNLAAGTTQSVTLNIPQPIPNELDADDGTIDARPFGTKFAFRVVDSSGQPVVGATVTTKHVWGDGPPQLWIEPKRFPPDATLFPPAVTDEDGIARFEFPDDDALVNAGYPKERETQIRETFQKRSLRFQLRIEHPDHPTWDDSIFLRRPHPIVLADSTEIVVRAHRGDDSALATRLNPCVYNWSDTDFIEKDGVLTLRNRDVSSESAMRFLRIVQVPKDGPAWFSDLIDLQHQQGPQVSLDLKLKQGIRLEGRLSENVPRPIVNGRIVANFTRGSFRTGWYWMATADIAPDGTFVFESLPPDEHAELVALCDGWVSVCPTVDEVQSYCKQYDFEAPSYADPVRLKNRRGDVFPRLAYLDQPVTQTVIPMGRTAIAEIMVVDEDDKPIENANVGFSPNQIGFNNGASILGDGFNLLDLIREQLDSGKPPTDDAPWGKWSRDRYFGRTDSHGIAIVTDLPAGAIGNEIEPVRYLFSVNHDDHVVAVPAVPNRVHYEDSSAINLVAGQKGTVTVKMKRH